MGVWGGHSAVQPHGVGGVGGERRDTHTHTHTQEHTQDVHANVAPTL